MKFNFVENFLIFALILATFLYLSVGHMIPDPIGDYIKPKKECKSKEEIVIRLNSNYNNPGDEQKRLHKDDYIYEPL